MAKIPDADVIVVGAGLTGLRAAHRLSEAGLSVLVFERSGHIGGRMATHEAGGYKIDRGFQVLLTAYPEVRAIEGSNNLGCRSFSSGARIRRNGVFVDFMDPLRHPEEIFTVLRSSLGSFSDFIRLFFLTRRGGRACASRNLSTDLGLTASGFSRQFQDGFLRPFLRGILLDPHLRADFGLACFYLQMFSKGEAALPEGGIQALPNLLADQVGLSHIRLNAIVNTITPNEVTLDNGDSYRARQVICAVDTMSATQLGSPEQTMHHLASCTLYFSASKAPFHEPLIVLNADSGPIATLAVLSNVQPSYAPPGRALIAITAIGEAASLSEETLKGSILSQALTWYGAEVQDWNYLMRVALPASVVSRPRMSVGYCEVSGVLYAGDYLAYPSQNGALSAGRSVADFVLERLT
jgi:phytoene dehydrogenase-like protein